MTICTSRFATSDLNAAPTSEAPTQSDTSSKEPLPTADEVNSLRTEVKSLLASNAKIDEKYKRALAESENMRKRFMRQIDEAKLFGVQSFCKDLLEVADVLTIATEMTQEEQLKPGTNPHYANLFEGLKMTEQQMLKVFQRHQLIRIEPTEGERFDPNIHEAVFQAPMKEGIQANTIAVVTKIGYKLHDRTLRPACVGVFGP